jgi:hypothetical protein
LIIGFETISDEQLLLVEKRTVIRNQIRNNLLPSIETYIRLNDIFEIIRKTIPLYRLRGNQVKEMYLTRCVRSDIVGCLEISDDNSTYILKPSRLTIKNEENKESRYILDIQSIEDKDITNFRENVIRYGEANFFDNILGRSLIKNAPKIVLSGEIDITFETY